MTGFFYFFPPPSDSSRVAPGRAVGHRGAIGLAPSPPRSGGEPDPHLRTQPGQPVRLPDGPPATRLLCAQSPDELAALEFSTSHRGIGLRLTRRGPAPGHIEPTKSRRRTVFAATQADRSNTLNRRLASFNSCTRSENVSVRNPRRSKPNSSARPIISVARTKALRLCPPVKMLTFGVSSVVSPLVWTVSLSELLLDSVWQGTSFGGTFTRKL